MKRKSITQFVETEWRGFFDHISQNKNAILPYEGLLEVERKILYAAKMMNLSMTSEELTRKLAADTGLYHISGEASVQDTVKSMASSYKRQHEIMLLKGAGAFPTSLSNTGAAARYTHILATPLSRKIFEDTEFCPYYLDDSGIEQPEYLIPPMPLGVIRTMKNIGVGKACFIMERPHDEVYKWAKDIIDKAYSGKTSGYAPTFYKEIKNSNIVESDGIRNFETSATHNEIDKKVLDAIYKMTPPDPFFHTGCNVTYDPVQKAVWMEAKVEVVKDGSKTRYFITDLPLNVSDKVVMKKIADKYGNSIMEKVIDRSGDGHPIYLEIPRSIYNDKEAWSALGLKQAIREQYVFWNEELKAPAIYNSLHTIVLEWYKKREEVVVKRLYHDAALAIRKIHQNELIKKYYNDTVVAGGKKLKTEEEVIAKYGEEDGRFLYNLPQKTYLPKNVESLEAKNSDLKKKISEIEKNIENIKEYIFNEWKSVADANVKFFEGEL